MRETLALIARHHRLQDALPDIGAVDIAGAQSAAFQITELVEYEERMITGAFVMAVPDAHLVRRAHARIHVGTTFLSERSRFFIYSSIWAIRCNMTTSIFSWPWAWFSAW
jgi:hypothetical protein